MSRADVVRRYLRSMEEADLAGTLACFADDATVSSPVYGRGPVRPFYEKLFADTRAVRITLVDLYVAIGSEERLAAYFKYWWERIEGPPVDTALLDLFQFQPGTDRIAHLDIVFTGGPIAKA